MKIAKVKFIAAVAAGVLVGVILTTAVYFSFLSSSGMRLVPAKEYRRLESMDKRYSKLWKIQNLAQKNSLKYIRVDKQMNALYRALLKSYGEPYSVYMTPEETKRFDGRLNGSYSGIGAALEESGGQVRISRVMDKSPARSAGLKQGDVILQVNGKTSQTISGTAKLLRGKTGSSLKLLIQRGKEKKSVTIIRGEVSGDSVTSAVLHHNIGYIWISAFQKNTASEFQTELSAMEDRGVKGVVIDLRGNGGGYTSQGIKTADQLLPACTITSMQKNSGPRKYYNSDETCTKLKYVVLVNGETASSAEIVAAAIQDNNGGKLIGSRTFGKGVVQSEYHLDDGSAVRLTVMQYFTPDGKKINEKGIKPDITVRQESGNSDRQLERAISELEK
jgi:carboxyl-terminal processing protease